MARDLTTEFLAALDSAQFRPVLLYEGEFGSGTVRLWSGLGTLPWNGQQWLGAGKLASISAIEETTELRANAVQFTLSGIDPAQISLVLADTIKGKPGKLWFGVLDGNDAVIADPHLTYEGRLDVPQITDDGATAAVTITYESHLVDLERSPGRRYTHESQQERHSGDKGFEYVEGLQNWSGVWGQT